MLMNLMIKDAVLMGLAPLIGCGAPAFDGYYKVHEINGTRAIEFFKGKGPKPSSNDVTVLPYQPGKIASANVQAGEVISGEFTGCIMSVYLEDGTLKCAHVDTNLDNPQRKAYEAKKANGTFSVRAEDDTTGKFGPQAGHPEYQNYLRGRFSISPALFRRTIGVENQLP